MARLHDDGGCHPDTGEHHNARVAGHCVFRQIDGLAERIEAILHVVNTEEQKAQAREHVASTLQALGLLEHQDDAKYQHGHGIGRQVHFQAETGYKPGAGRGAQIGTKNNPDSRGQPQQSGAQKRDGDHGDE